MLRSIAALPLTFALTFVTSFAFAQANGNGNGNGGGPAGNQGGECTGGFCGTPNQTGGGGCSCSCGCSILINRTDVGDTYQYADDYDDDGFEDDFDNCPFATNAEQLDSDGDGVGDTCDSCAGAANPTQGDVDGDGLGDACDDDADNDQIANARDVCASVANPSQRDTDGDALGDACDEDDDNDGVLDAEDDCPLSSSGGPCRADDDVDGRPDDIDNCLGVNNFDQADLDRDGVGDVCDGDIDGDLIANLTDNCPRIGDATLLDSDRDGVGDRCDDRLCYVIDRADANHCLDDETTFTVLSVPSDIVSIGDARRLRIFANRENVAMRYTWTVIRRPDGSENQVRNPRGSVTYSDAHEYRYLKEQAAEFTPDVPGDYELQLSAELVFPDERFPNNNTSRATFALTASDEGASSGCVCFTADGQASVGGAAALFLLFLGTVLFVRKSRS